MPESPNDAIKRQAHDLYLAHQTSADISRALGVTPKTLTKWRREGSWEIEREDADRSLIDDNFAARKLTVAFLLTHSAGQIKRAVEHIVQRPDPPSLAEAEKLALILTNLHKISQLDAGKATENISVQSAVKLTLEDIRGIMKADPFGAIDVSGE